MREKGGGGLHNSARFTVQRSEMERKNSHRYTCKPITYTVKGVASQDAGKDRGIRGKEWRWGGGDNIATPYVVCLCSMAI